MTRKELSQYYWLTKEIEADERRLRTLREKALSTPSQRFSGMPAGGGSQDSMAESVTRIVDLENRIKRKRERCLKELQKIEDFIEAIPDSMTRMIFTYRCVECMTWREVAANMGYRMSEDNARQVFHRYLRETENEET